MGYVRHTFGGTGVGGEEGFQLAWFTLANVLKLFKEGDHAFWIIARIVNVPGPQLISLSLIIPTEFHESRVSSKLCAHFRYPSYGSTSAAQSSSQAAQNEIGDASFFHLIRAVTSHDVRNLMAQHACHLTLII